MRKNELEIWYSCTKLVTFTTMETRSNKRKHTHNQECKNNYITHLIHCRSLSNLTIQKTLSYLINIACFSVFSLIY